MEIIDIIGLEEKNQEIIKNDFFTIKYLYFDAGKGMLSHTEQAMATIQVIEGLITFVLDDEDKRFRMSSSTILEFDGRSAHSIIAHEDSRVLITIVPIK